MLNLSHEIYIYILFTMVTGLLFLSCEKEEGSGNFEFGVEKSCKLKVDYQSVDNIELEVYDVQLKLKKLED